VDHKLHVYATMGNATTFPVELLVFYALALSCELYNNHVSRYYKVYPSLLKHTLLKSIRDNKHCVSVFGDDCIVPRETCLLFIEVCSSLGFSVNNAKTFCHGPFRESCGGDFYRGVCVRPVFIKGPINTTRLSSLEAFLYTVWNECDRIYQNLYGTLTYLYDKALFWCLRSLFVRFNFKVRVVPNDFPSDSGLRSSDWQRFVKHYNFALHPIVLDQHGTAHFSYLSFKFKEKLDLDEPLRCSDHLQKRCNERLDILFSVLPVALKSVNPTRRLRKNGQYNVATSLGSYSKFVPSGGRAHALPSS